MQGTSKGLTESIRLREYLVCVTGDTKIVFLAILVYLTIVIAFVAYLFPYMSFSYWLALSSLLVLGVSVLRYGLKALLKMLERPKLKIVRSKIESQHVGAAGEYKDLYLIVQNVGGQEAIDCQVKAKVRGSQEPYYVAGVPFSLEAHNEKSIRFQQVIKSEQKVQPNFGRGPIMDRGNIYEYEIYFYGNFKDTKAHRLRLDLTSWENIGVILDC